MGDVLKAAQSDDEAATLRAMRDSLAAAMDDAPASVVAQVAARLESVLRRLTELEPAGKVTLDDVLAERRADRERNSHTPKRTRRTSASAG